MSDATADEIDKPAGKSRKGLMIGLLLALLGGAGGFAFTSGMISLGGDKEQKKMGEEFAFVPVEPMTILLGNSAERRYLRFRAELEVDAGKKSEVEAMLPRVVDVLNTYLRSLDMADIEDPSSLLTLRAQMRRRIDLVVGGDAVHDLLVMEFVVN
jgi:flagellar FliL protein